MPLPEIRRQLVITNVRAALGVASRGEPDAARGNQNNLRRQRRTTREHGKVILERHRRRMRSPNATEWPLTAEVEQSFCPRRVDRVPRQPILSDNRWIMLPARRDQRHRIVLQTQYLVESRVRSLDLPQVQNNELSIRAVAHKRRRLDYNVRDKVAVEQRHCVRLARHRQVAVLE